MKHWRIETDPQGIAWLTFDQTGRNVNTLNSETLAELDSALASIEQQAPVGLVIGSAKGAGFIAGADVERFAGLRDPAQVEAMIHGAHAVLFRLERLPCPSVAMIAGHCLGGGLELALACGYRVAVDTPETRLGFPEIRLGIFPGFGGSVRAPARVGHLTALDLMLSGRSLSARTARSIGLIDACVPPRQQQAAALQLLQQPPPRRRPALWQRAAGWPGVRPLVAAGLRRRVAAHADPAHYPAPGALIAHWQRHARDPAALYVGEARVVAALLTGDTAQNLVRLFLLRERLRKQAPRPLGPTGEDGGGLPDAPALRHLHVVGAGIMGGDIAAWAALRGLKVSLQDRTAGELAPAIERARALFAHKLKGRRQIRAALDRLIPDPRGDGVAQADLVLEAIVEDVDAKRGLLRTLEPRLHPQALLATNTSSIPLETLGVALEHPARLIGLHFFNPVAKMPLLEIVRSTATDAAAIARALAFARRLDKLPLQVASSPGFLVNRVLMPYLLEAVTLVEEGLDPDRVDRAATAYGMPVGPIELADTVGLDICLSVARTLAVPVPPSLRRQVDAHQLGRKTGQGYYRWRGGKVQRRSGRAGVDVGVQERLMLRLLNEAVACLREGVIDSADELDAGLVFGAGFAPFRGGPLHDLRQTGVAERQARLTALQQTLGERFEPDPGWQALAPG